MLAGPLSRARGMSAGYLTRRAQLCVVSQR